MADPVRFSKAERHVFNKHILHLLLEQDDASIVQWLTPKETQLKELHALLIPHGLSALQVVWPQWANKRDQMDKNLLDAECRQMFSRIDAYYALLDDAVQESKKAKFIFLKNLYNVCKGKAVVQVPEATPAHKEPTRSILYRLSVTYISFLRAQILGQGAFGKVSLVTVHNSAFKDDKYAAKEIVRASSGMDLEASAALEATKVCVSHPGVIQAIGIVSDERRPLLIMQYWNGNTLRHWITYFKATGKQSMASSFRDAPDQEACASMIEDQLFDIVAGLLSTVQCLHDNSIMHNDLHPDNVLFHFDKASEKVYVGIADWGKSTFVNTTKTVVPLPPDVTADEWHQRFPHLAPECISATPPPFNTRQEIYSLCYIIRRLLRVVDFLDELKATAVRHMLTCLQYGKYEDPQQRCSIHTLSRFMLNLRRFGIVLSDAVGLRPAHA